MPRSRFAPSRFAVVAFLLVWAAALGGVLSPQAAAQGPITVSVVEPSGTPLLVGRFTRLELSARFATPAKNLYLPYDANPPVNIEPRTGVTVEALFLEPGETDWNRARKQQGFRYQNVSFESADPGDFRVRFAPDIESSEPWRYRVRVTDANGVRESAIGNFTCVASSHPGYLRVAPNDPRYFEHANGRPFYPVPGLHDSRPEDLERAQGAYNLTRIWWSYSFRLSANNWYIGNVAPAGHQRSVRGAVSENTPPFSIRGGRAASGERYEMRVLVATDDLNGPRNPAQDWGVRLFSPFHWLNPSEVEVQAFNPASPYAANEDPGAWQEVNNGRWKGSAPEDLKWYWLRVRFDFNDPKGNFADHWLVEISNCFDGEVYLARTSLRRVFPGGTYGPELSNNPAVDNHREYSQAVSAELDQQLAVATANDMYLKIVTFDKLDPVWATLGPNALFTEFNVYGPSDTNEVDWRRWYQRAYIRYITARYGWSPYIHSLEFVNEASPQPTHPHFAGANHFARYIHNVASRPLMATTSTWHSFPVPLWLNSDLDYTDKHQFVSETLGNLPPGKLGDDAQRGTVAELVGNVVGTNEARLAQIQVTPGGRYRIRYFARAENLSLTQPTGGPGIKIRFTDFPAEQEVVDDNSFNFGTAYLRSNPENRSGTWGWEEHETDVFTVPSQASYVFAFVVNNLAGGTALLDDVRLEDVSTGQIRRFYNGDFESSRLKPDTALWGPYFWENYLGDGTTIPRTVQKPNIWGELGIPNTDDPNATVSQDPRVDRDTEGVWLHKIVWSCVNPSGTFPLFWWTQSIHEYNLYGSARAFRSFMDGVPLTNGRYVDAAPVLTGGLRAWGQKDVAAGEMHLWIDNPNHTWLNVVNNASMPTLSGQVSVGGFRNGRYLVDWWDTRAGVITRQEAVDVTDGTLRLDAGSVPTDVAVKVRSASVASLPLFGLAYDNSYYLLTDNASEHDFLLSVGWLSQGAIGYVYPDSNNVSGLTALYRLYNPQNGDHFYTINVAERNAAVSGGYIAEGTSGYVFDQAGQGRKPLYRALNPSTGQHRYTTNAAQYNALPSAWSREGIAAYVQE